jgi:uncharacterized protein (TIGR02757 family)
VTASTARLKETLDVLYTSFGPADAGSDPVSLVRLYPDARDREVAGWIAAAFAYGRVDIILRNVGGLLARLGPSPAAALAKRRFPAADLGFFRHRFHGPDDAAALLNVIGDSLRRDGAVEPMFARYFAPERSVAGCLTGVSREILSGLENPSAAVRFLFPSPEDGSACKRWNLYLRWMVRSDSIDFGIWKSIPAAALIIPADTHVHRVARRLGLTRRRAADWKTAEEITRRLAEFDGADPVKYDFALCRLGVLEICRARPRLSDCPTCPARGVCATGRRRLAALEAAA